MPQMGGRQGGGGPMGGGRSMGNERPMGGGRSMGNERPMGGGRPMGNDRPMGGGRPMGHERPMGGPARRPMRYGADPRHPAPFGLIVADVIWNRAHFNRVRNVLIKMTYNEPISPIEDRILYESFGRRIEYYEAAELLAWVDRELSYL